jgi:hypothetical protein
MPHRSIMYFGILLCFNLISCDLFKTRTPAEPSQQSSNWVPPFEYSQVLQNMVNSFQDGNIDHYLISFSDASFTFEPSTNAHGKYGINWTSWTKTDEQKYITNVLNHFNNSRPVLIFDPFTPTININNTYQVETTYIITLPLEAGVIKKFRGQVQLTLAQDQSGSWSINQWVDVGTDSTWSDLKGVASSQW